MPKPKKLSKTSAHYHIPLPETKCIGTTTMGERGQIVIPSEVRRSLHLKPGDKMVVFVNHGKMLSMLKADALRNLIDTMSKEFRRVKILTNHKH